MGRCTLMICSEGVKTHMSQFVAALGHDPMARTFTEGVGLAASANPAGAITHRMAQDTSAEGTYPDIVSTFASTKLLPLLDDKGLVIDWSPYGLMAQVTLTTAFLTNTFDVYIAAGDSTPIETWRNAILASRNLAIKEYPRV